MIGSTQANLGVFRLKDESLEGTENLPSSPGELAAETVAFLEVALEEFRAAEEALKGE